MKKAIDQLIKQHTEGYQKYVFQCNVSDFKKLQILMRDEYKIKDYPGLTAMWNHIVDVENPRRIGTVRFKHFELNVICPSKYKNGVRITKVEDSVIDKKIFKNTK